MKPTTAIKVGTTLVALTGEYPTCMCGTRRHFLCVVEYAQLEIKKTLEKKKPALYVALFSLQVG